MRAPRIRTAVAAIALGLLALTVVPAAPAAAEEVRNLRAFGASDTIVLTGAYAERTISVPFDAAAPPLRLDGLVEHGLGDEAGTLEALVDDVRVAMVLVTSEAPTPFSVDLRGLVPAGPEATTLDIRLVSRFPLSDRYCTGRATVPYLRLTDLTATFADSGLPPQSIGTFFPPLLDRVVLWVPAEPTATTADAVLKLTLGIVDKYRGQQVAIDVHAMPAGGLGPLPHQTSVRHIVVGDPEAESVLLVDTGGSGKLLVLPEEGLVTAALGVLQEITKLAVGPAASYQQRMGDAVVPPLEQRLIDLGAPATVVTAQGGAAIELVVPQAAFGGMVTAYDLRLSGRVMADREVVLSVLVNNELVDAHRTTGAFRRRIHIVDPPLTRAVTIRIEANEVGDEGRCTGRDDPVSLQLTDHASLRATLGVTPRISFQLLPQALLPDVDVVFSAFTPKTIDVAAALVADLAAGVPRGIGVRVVPTLADLVASPRPGIVVWSGPPGELERAGLRVVPDASLTALDLLERDGRLPSGVPVAQVARTGGRHVLLVNGPDDDTLQRFVHRLVDPPSDLTRFDGDVVVLDGDRLRDVQLTVIPDPPVHRESRLALPATAWLGVGVGAAAVLVAALAARALRRRRASRAP